MTQEEFDRLEKGQVVKAFTRVDGILGWHDSKIIRKNLVTNTVRLKMVDDKTLQETHTRITVRTK